MTDDARDSAPETERMPERLEDALVPAGPVATVVVGVVFALLYGYGLFQAVANLVALPRVYATFGIAAATPWAALIAGIAVPVVLFVAALLLGRRRPLVNRVLILAAGLGTANALALTLAALVQALQPAFAS